MALPAGFQARQMKPETDIVAFDMVLVMDKFTAADVLREVDFLLHSKSMVHEPAAPVAFCYQHVPMQRTYWTLRRL